MGVIPVDRDYVAGQHVLGQAYRPECGPVGPHEFVGGG